MVVFIEVNELLANLDRLVIEATLHASEPHPSRRTPSEYTNSRAI
jgi:hypothetical protein